MPFRPAAMTASIARAESRAKGKKPRISSGLTRKAPAAAPGTADVNEVVRDYTKADPPIHADVAFAAAAIEAVNVPLPSRGPFPFAGNQRFFYSCPHSGR